MEENNLKTEVDMITREMASATDINKTTVLNWAKRLMFLVGSEHEKTDWMDNDGI